MDRKPVLSTEHICELCSRIVLHNGASGRKPFGRSDPVLRDGKVEFKGYFHGYREFFSRP